jgi:acetyl esterase/lipase
MDGGMKLRIMAGLAGFGLLFASIGAAAVQAQEEGGPFRERMRQRMAARLADRMTEPSAAGATEHAYGGDPLQRLDLWRPASAKAPAPLVIFVHGGGWKRGDKGNATGATKIEHLLGEGYAVASVNYRLVPAATVEEQAADVAKAVAWLRSHAAEQRIDPARIVLMGHSAGAHLVALVGTDARYLRAAGLGLNELRGVIALDGACYDVPRQIAEGGNVMRATYAQAFGDQPARQRLLSPIDHAAAPNAPAFLILHVDRADGKAQSEALAAALEKAGTPAEVKGFEGTGLRGHMEINRSLGDPAYPATAVVDAWLRKVVG